MASAGAPPPDAIHGTPNHDTNFITSYINTVLNESSDTTYVSNTDLLDGNYFREGPTTDFYINRTVNNADANVLMNDFKFFDSSLTQEEVTHYYEESIV
jgi:hypothetical protein